jgi:hypothetical protein
MIVGLAAATFMVVSSQLDRLKQLARHATHAVVAGEALGVENEHVDRIETE